MKKIIYLFILLAPFYLIAQNKTPTPTSSQENLTVTKCAPILDAQLKPVKVYRSQTSVNGRCAPGNSSFVVAKDPAVEANGIAIDGFVVGIENFYYGETLDQVIKITSKAGAHTTIVRLLKLDTATSKLSQIPGGTFSSSMEYIVIDRSSQKTQVRVRNHSSENNCQFVFEEAFSFAGNQFQSEGKKEVEKVCQ